MSDAQELLHELHQLVHDIDGHAIRNNKLKVSLTKFVRLCQQTLDNDTLNKICMAINAITDSLTQLPTNGNEEEEAEISNLVDSCNKTVMAIADVVLQSNRAVYERGGAGMQSRIVALRQAHANLNTTAGTIDNITAVISFVEALLGILTYALGLPV